MKCKNFIALAFWSKHRANWIRRHSHAVSLYKISTRLGQQITMDGKIIGILSPKTISPRTEASHNLKTIVTKIGYNHSETILLEGS